MRRLIREILFLAASAGVVLCTTAVKVWEDGCPDTLRGYCGLPMPFTPCDRRFFWREWHWAFWIDLAIAYFVVLGLRHFLRNRRRQKAH